MVLQENLTAIQLAYRGVFVITLLILAVMLFACLIRAVKGPGVADRIVAVNMMGTMVMVMIAVLSLLLSEGYLVDICLIYAMVSFLAVIVLTKVYVGIYEEKRRGKKDGEEGPESEEDGHAGN